MRPRTLGVVLVLAVVSAGCLGAGGPLAGNDATPTPKPTSAPSDTPTPAPTATPTTTSEPTTASTATPEPTATSTPEWTTPRPPNAPEGKYDPDDPTRDENNQTRIFGVRVVNKEPATDGSGLTDFDVEVDANTTMRNVDPPEHGTVRGEPYFLIYVDDELIYRSEQVEFRNGTFTLDVHPGSLEQFDQGSLKLVVFLMDRDSTYDDEYAYETVRVRYAGE